MLKEQEYQEALEFVSLEMLIPEDNLLRKIEKQFDFSFIREKVKSLYCQDNGRPAVDPVILFKMLFIGYFFGIRSERQLVKEIELNVAYRWFLGYRLRDKIPHHSTISQNRRRRFAESNIYQEIFDEIVHSAKEKGLVEGKVLYTDSTHLKASANKNKYDKKKVERSVRKYIAGLDEAVGKDREEKGKKPLKEKEPRKEEKEIKVSKTDPESGYLVREGKPRGFFYCDHRTVDGKYNIITDTYALPGNVHDSVPYLERLDYQIRHFGFKVESVGLDAGYFTSEICKGIIERGIYGAIAYNRPKGKKNGFRRRDYKYDKEEDCYYCPAGEKLTYSNTSREGLKLYASNAEKCKDCPFLEKCTASQNHRKILSRHIWEEYKEEINQHRFEEKGKKIYARRKETVERSFADAKQLHGYRYARMRGLKKVREQCLLTAACQNMKKMALHINQNGPFFNILLSMSYLKSFRNAFLTNYKIISQVA